MTDHPKPDSGAETEIWNAIAAFEKILEVLPDDRVSLETLAEAYAKVGDATRSQEYVLRLANVFIEDGDEDAAQELLTIIKSFDQHNPKVQEAVTRIKNLKPKKTFASIDDSDSTLTKRASSIASEISFAWNLLQAEKVTQEEYAYIVHDLSEHPAKSKEVPVSTLHVLHDRNHPGLPNIMAHAATTCNTPVIPLSSYELLSKITEILPLDFMIKRGAIPFEIMGNDVLVAILNPYDAALSADIEALTGKICHRFIVAPAEFDSTLEKIKKAAEESPTPG